jgi:predicted signal transduction protein with EAL and GGDEF domain
MVGDLVLKEVAKRLNACISGRALVARYGGDEFTVVADMSPQQPDAAALARAVVKALGQPIPLGDITVTIGATVGMAQFPQDGRSEDELFRRADAALYRAKANGRGEVCVYDALQDETTEGRAVLEQEMREGIRLGQFLPYYQPIVELRSRDVQSLELLCRWQHPTLGLLAPERFIALAVELGLIGPMMFSMLRYACAEMERFPAAWRVSINLAPTQILEPDLVPALLALLKEFKVSPTRLDIELTEAALVSHTAQARETMMALRAAGITVTLDDFGTGYSCLSYLAETDIHTLKIDRSFVHSLHDKVESTKIVAAVINLSRSLGANAVAEGVESERDVRTLLHLGCRLGQGFLFGEPMPAERLLAATQAAATA